MFKINNIKPAIENPINVMYGITLSRSVRNDAVVMVVRPMIGNAPTVAPASVTIPSPPLNFVKIEFQ